MWKRFISDLRDLWTLLTKGQPEVDPLLPWRMMAELAKYQPPTEDMDAWEGKMYALPGNYAFWFAFDRYRGSPCDWGDRQARYEKMDAAKSLIADNR